MRKTALVLALLLALAVSGGAQAETLRVIGFNVESGGAHPDTIAEQMLELGEADVWGFSEVEKFWWAMKFKEAATTMTGDPYYFDWGTTGGGDRLMLLYNTAKLEKVGDHMELHDINPGGRVRAPLVTRLKVKATGEEFFAMVNHLYRKRGDLRAQQAAQLRDWAAQQTIPVIAIGDYNFDWTESGHNQGFVAMTQGDIFKWIKPDPILPSQCHPDYKSILDFVFVSGAAKDWPATSDILFPDASYCPDDNLTSDHRPVEGIFTLPGGDDPAVAGTTEAKLEELKMAVTALQAALDEVKSKLAALENGG